MYLQEIFDSLSYGELSQLSIGGAEAGVIDASNYPRVLTQINLGLTDLFKRFTLKEGRITLALIPGRSEYPINSKYVVGNTRSRELVRYLEENPAAHFRDDMLKIERVLTDAGEELELNNVAEKYSAFTPNMTTLRVHPDIAARDINLPDWLKTSKLELVYRANHPKLVMGIGLFDPTRIVVQLPDSHLNALMLFIASKLHTPIGIEGQFNAGNNYFAKYEAACKDLENEDLKIDQGGGTNEKFRARGWA